MTTVTLTTQIDGHLLDDAQRLVDAGEFDSLRELVAEALAQLLRKYEMAGATIAQQQITARIVQGMTARLDPPAREQFEEFVAAYTSVAEEPPTDDAMVSLLEIFSAFGFKDALAAVHDVQHSKVMLTPRYLMTILEKVTPVSYPEINSGASYTKQHEHDLLSSLVLGEQDTVLAEVAKLYGQEIEKFEPITEMRADDMRQLVAEYHDLERWRQGFAAMSIRSPERRWRYVVKCVKNYGNESSVLNRKVQAKRDISKSEQHRAEKRRQNEDYYRRWEDKAKARKKSQSTVGH